MILVTGSNGFIGSELVFFLAKKFNVYALTREDNNLENFKNIKFIYSDYQKIDDSLIKILSNVNVIIHCAGNAKFGNGSIYKQNITSTSFIIKLAKLSKKNIRIIFTSTFGVHDRGKFDFNFKPLNENSTLSPTSDYGKSKLASELLIKNSGLDYTIIRLPMVIGKRMRTESHFMYFISEAIRDKLFSKLYFPGKFSFIDIDELSKRILYIVLKPNLFKNKIFLFGPYQVCLGEIFERSKNKKILINLTIFSKLVYPFLPIIPFKLKALFFPALCADESYFKMFYKKNPDDPIKKLNDLIIIKKSQINFFEKLPNKGATLITGANSGLGFAFLKKILPYRDLIYVIDNKITNIQELKSEKIKLLQFDLTKTSDIENIIKKKFNNSNILELFQFAGVGNKDLFYKNYDKEIKVVNLNLNARYLISSLIVPNMIKNNFGRIVNISSSTAFQSIPYMAMYSASNAALMFLTESMIYELSNKNIQILGVCPSGMNTDFQRSAGVLKRKNEKLLDADYVADKIINELERGRSKIIFVGMRTFIMSLLSRILPRSLNLLLWGRLIKRLR